MDRFYLVNCLINFNPNRKLSRVSVVYVSHEKIVSVGGQHFGRVSIVHSAHLDLDFKR